MRMPNLNALRMFDAAARHLNFRLAAEELSLTQGAVAQQVRRLEADLNVALFYRQARGLALTDAGRGYHVPIRRALAMIEKATGKLQPDATRVRLSVTPSFAAKWLVPRLPKFRQAHPGIDIDTQASEQLANFREDGVDIAIRQGEPPDSREFASRELSTLSLRAVCSREYADKIGQPKEFSELIKYQLIQDSHRHWETLLTEMERTASIPIMQFNQTALAMDAAMQGEGIALVPRLLLEDALKQAQLVDIWQDTRVNREGFYLVYPKSDLLHKSRDLVTDWILSEVNRGH